MKTDCCPNRLLFMPCNHAQAQAVQGKPTDFACEPKNHQAALHDCRICLAGMHGTPTPVSTAQGPPQNRSASCSYAGIDIRAALRWDAATLKPWSSKKP